MVALKAAQTPRQLANPDAKYRAFLLYGPDTGLVSDRAATLVRTLAGRFDPEAEIIRIDERDLADDPDRLAVEAQTVSMFASQKVVRVKTGPRLNADLLGELIEAGNAALLVVEAGNLRPAAKLRKTFETAAAAAALPCYSDAARDIGPLIDLTLESFGCSIAPDAKAALLTLVGADPALARSEVKKVALYAGDGAAITLQDIEAIVADSGDLALDALAQSAADKTRGPALRQLDRLTAAGQSPQAALAVLTRHFERLHRVIGDIESGMPAARAVAAIRPPVGFSQRDALLRQARLWSRTGVQQAMIALQSAVAQSRRRPQLDRQITERLLLRLCQ